MIKKGTLVGIKLRGSIWQVAETHNYHEGASRPYELRYLRHRDTEWFPTTRRKLIRTDWWECIHFRDIPHLTICEIAKAKMSSEHFNRSLKYREEFAEAFDIQYNIEKGE
jgi:hypothetical protein